MKSHSFNEYLFAIELQHFADNGHFCPDLWQQQKSGVSGSEVVEAKIGLGLRVKGMEVESLLAGEYQNEKIVELGKQYVHLEL